MGTQKTAQDRAWLEELFELHHRLVRAYAVRRLGPDSADDVVSEVFAVAWRRRGVVPEPAAGWLLRAARNVVLHEQRSRARRSRLAGAVASQPVDHSPAADQVTTSLIESVLSCLPAIDAEILRLTAWEQLNPTEIAYVLDLSPGAARNRLLRARRRAQALLDPSHEPLARFTVVPDPSL